MKAISINVRRADSSDIDRIIEIERSWMHLSHWSLDAYYRLIEEDSPTPSLVAETERSGGELEIAGFVIFHVADRVAEIYNIAVDGAHARLGVGTCLMQQVIEESRMRGARKLMLEVRKSNLGAIHFYNRFRFQIAGERHNYYSNPLEDAYVMERDLRL
jgi:ribosomal-protein-alanine N-acetyltransferase